MKRMSSSRSKHIDGPHIAAGMLRLHVRDTLGIRIMGFREMRVNEGGFTDLLHVQVEERRVEHGNPQCDRRDVCSSLSHGYRNDIRNVHSAESPSSVSAEKIVNLKDGIRECHGRNGLATM